MHARPLGCFDERLDGASNGSGTNHGLLLLGYQRLVWQESLEERQPLCKAATLPVHLIFTSTCREHTLTVILRTFRKLPRKGGSLINKVRCCFTLILC